MSQVTVRIQYQHYQQTDKAIRLELHGEIIWIPKGSIEISVNNGFQDIEMPSWLAIQKGLEDYIVAEY